MYTMTYHVLFDFTEQVGQFNYFHEIKKKDLI